MPLRSMDKVGFTHGGRNCTAQRLIYSIGSSGRLAQVVEFEGRQFVDDNLYGEADEERMSEAAVELLLAGLSP